MHFRRNVEHERDILEISKLQKSRSSVSVHEPWRHLEPGTLADDQMFKNFIRRSDRLLHLLASFPHDLAFRMTG